MNNISTFALSERIGTQFLITAHEAFPALERAFMSARREIWASFRIFDLTTKLRTPEARQIGDTWFDLIIHVLGRKVAVRMVLTDFDPIGRPAMHRKTWRSIRQFIAAREIAGPDADIDIVPGMHPAQTGVLPGIVVWPMVQNKLRKTVAWLNRMTPDERTANLREMPGLARYIRVRKDGRVSAVFTRFPNLFPATHHQKLAVIDRRLLYIGGIDLNERRYDDLQHQRPGEETWQDVQILTDGPPVAEAQAHLERFPAVVAGLADPPAQRRLVRTLSRRRKASAAYFGPEPVANEIALAHQRFCGEARKLIYLETQFFRDRRLARSLARAGRRNRDLNLLIMLPGAPEDVAFDASESPDARFGEFLQWRCLRILQRAFRERLFVGAGAQPRRPAKPAPDNRRERLRGAELVYIHSKVSVFDESRAIVSSANLNGRSLRWDTEAGLVFEDPADVTELRSRVFSHWLPEGAGAAFHDPRRAVQHWRALALKNAHRAPEEREGFILPYDFKAAARYGMPLPGIPEEMV